MLPQNPPELLPIIVPKFLQLINSQYPLFPTPLPQKPPELLLLITKFFYNYLIYNIHQYHRNLHNLLK